MVNNLSGSEIEFEESESEEVKITVEAICQNLVKIDTVINQTMVKKELSELAVMERAILRMGAFELLITKSTPYQIVINEAIEIAKRYSDPKSAPLINRVLDAIWKESGNKPQITEQKES